MDTPRAVTLTRITAGANALELISKEIRNYGWNPEEVETILRVQKIIANRVDEKRNSVLKY